MYILHTHLFPSLLPQFWWKPNEKRTKQFKKYFYKCIQLLLFSCSSLAVSPPFIIRPLLKMPHSLSSIDFLQGVPVLRVGVTCCISSILQMGKGPWCIYGNGRPKAPHNKGTIFIVALPPAAVSFSCVPCNNVCALSGPSVVAISHCQMIHGFVLLNGLITWQTACCTGRLRSTTIIKINA